MACRRVHLLRKFRSIGPSAGGQRPISIQSRHTAITTDPANEIIAAKYASPVWCFDHAAAATQTTAFRLSQMHAVRRCQKAKAHAGATVIPFTNPANRPNGAGTISTNASGQVKNGMPPQSSPTTSRALNQNCRMRGFSSSVIVFRRFADLPAGSCRSRPQPDFFGHPERICAADESKDLPFCVPDLLPQTS
jgi:hypothetical protein